MANSPKKYIKVNAVDSCYSSAFTIGKSYEIEESYDDLYVIVNDAGYDVLVYVGGYDCDYELHYDVIYEDEIQTINAEAITDVDTSDNPVNPSHYKKGDFEVIDVIKVATEGASGIEAVCQGNIIKYVMRYREKNGVTDLKKARWYLDYLIDELEAVEKLEEGA